MPQLSKRLERLNAIVDFLTPLKALPLMRLRMTPPTGGFSLGEHFCHLRDLEIEGYAVRINQLLGRSSPVLRDFDGMAVARASSYRSEDALAALDTFIAARIINLKRIMPLSGRSLERSGTYENGESISLEALLDRMIEHDTEHRGEMEALLDDAVPA